MSKSNLRDNRENINKKSGLSPSGSNSSSNDTEYNSIPSDRFYTLKEEITLRFYQVPKALFRNPKYKGLSLGPKLMYSILRDRLDMSIKNNWKDKKGYIYLIFSVEELMNLLEMSNKIIIKYKKRLAKYGLIFEKRLGQGKANRIYILKPELPEFQKCRKYTSRSGKNTLLEVPKVHPSDTDVNETNLNNVNSNAVFNKKKRPPEKESLANYIAEQIEDDHSLGFYRRVVDTMPENLIYQALSEVKDTHLMGKLKKSRGALFNKIIQEKAAKNNIDLGMKKRK